MAKIKKRRETGNSVTTKSWFGSHAEMVIEELDDEKVICEDDRGRYITFKSRLDNGLADPRRNAEDRMMNNGATE
jgi:hypothetical protein